MSTIPKQYLAPRFSRLLAYIIDIFPIIFILCFIFYEFYGMTHIVEQYISEPENEKYATQFVELNNLISTIALIVWIAYCLFVDALPIQGTLGKKLMKIKVVDGAGKQLNPKQSFIRNLSKLISSIMFFGFIWILFDHNRQGLHDKFADTYIVRRDFLLK